MHIIEVTQILLIISLLQNQFHILYPGSHLVEDICIGVTHLRTKNINNDSNLYDFPRNVKKLKQQTCLLRSYYQ